MRASLPIVFVHGLIGGLDQPALLETVAREALAPDLLGYGMSRDVPASAIDCRAQAVELGRVLDAAGVGRAHLVAHSVGGVISALFAAEDPRRVVSLVSIEGNFTLADAFWSARIAALPEEEVAELLAADAADPRGWLARAGARVDADTVRLAGQALAYQPSSTVRAMARSVVEITGARAYEALLRELFAAVPVHLIAGKSSRDGWDVPSWALEQAASMTEVPGGHMMMLDHPESLGMSIARLLDDGVAASDSFKTPA